MIENLVDQAIAALINTIGGITVVVGMEDLSPDLETPFCVVYSNVQSFAGRNAIYELLTTVEYESISGPDAVANVESAMTSIDHVLSTQPSAGVISGLPLSSFKYLAWEDITKTNQVPGDRRKNVRELKVFAQLTSM